jgi:hypothetical protein
MKTILYLLIAALSLTGCADGKTSNESSETRFDSSWVPLGFEQHPSDSNISWRFLKSDEIPEGKCYQRCVGVEVIVKEGCPNRLTGEVQWVDANNVQIGSDFDSVSLVESMQSSKLIFGTSLEGEVAWNLAKISCY